MNKTRDYLFHHLAAPLTAMLILIGGAFFVYKGYYTGPQNFSDFSAIEPAAGDNDTGADSHAMRIRFGYRNLWQ